MVKVFMVILFFYVICPVTSILAVTPVDPSVGEYQIRFTNVTGQFPYTTQPANSIRVVWTWYTTGGVYEPDWNVAVYSRCESYDPINRTPINCGYEKHVPYNKNISDGANHIFYDTSVSEGKYYWYRVKVCDDQNCTQYSRPNILEGDSENIHGSWVGDRPVAPFVPTNVEATKGTDASGVTIYWTGNDPRMTDTFLVWRCTDTSLDSCVSAIEDLSPKDNRSKDYPPKTGTLYYYRVSACAKGRVGDWYHSQCSTFSAQDGGWAGATPPGAYPPGVPAAPTASDGTQKGKVIVSWKAVQGATYYLLYRSGLALVTLSATSYDDLNVTANKTYAYSLRACNDYDCSEIGPSDDGWARHRYVDVSWLHILILGIYGAPIH